MPALKHFLLVGVVFAFGLGWMLTILVNNPLGWGLHIVLRVPPERYYLGSLFLTLVSLALITGATVLGNRVFERIYGLSRLSRGALLASTLMFACVVLGYCSRELAADFDAIMNHLLFFYGHAWNGVALLSLPFLRLIGIPLIFFFVASSIRRRRLSS